MGQCGIGGGHCDIGTSFATERGGRDRMHHVYETSIGADDGKIMDYVMESEQRQSHAGEHL
jgi:hypothetical protein